MLELDIQIRSLPDSPGVYQYYDREDRILYVGKAKNLKKRVSSYFTKTHENGKTRVLVSKIARIDHIVVRTETDALLLENNLIKKYQPRYNVLLKDDKSYPWICIKKEAFPRVFMTRNVWKDGSEYFGPYTSVKTARALLALIKELYPLRTCAYNLSEVDKEELFRLQRYANFKFYIHPRRIFRILRSYPSKRALLRRFVTMARVKILTRRRGSFVE